MQEVEKGDALFQREQYRDAAAAYQRAVDTVPLDFNDGAAAFHLGECYRRLKDPERKSRIAEDAEIEDAAAEELRTDRTTDQPQD